MNNSLNDSYLIDPHRNIFYYYRGPEKKKTGDDFIYDKQIENNITKSLINTLEYSSYDTAMKAFLSLIEQRLDKCVLSFNTQKTSINYRFSLQTMPLMNADIKYKILLTISNSEAYDNVPSIQLGSRPDAWIIGGKDFAIMIESKISSAPDEKQLIGHIKSVGWEHEDYKRVDLKWPEVYACLKRAINIINDGKDSFIIGQFIKYLEVTGMAPFEGFKNADFDFFLDYENNREYGPVIKNKLKDFAALVYDKLPEEFKSTYSEPQSNRLTNDRAVMNFDKKTKQYDMCNFTLEVRSEGLCCRAVIGGRKVSDKKSPIYKIYNKLQNQKEFEQFREMLSELGKDFRILIHSRSSDNEGIKKPMPGGDNWSRKLDLSLDSLTGEGLQAIMSLLVYINYPGIIVDRLIPKGSPELNNPDLLVEKSVDSLTRLRKVIDFVEN
jgi:hypothetical protein